MSASPRSPLPSATPHHPSSAHAPTRNKSSSALSSHSTSRPKRNKSSSSLVLHHGHHSVQFSHHGKKPAHKRAGSTGRKAAIDFGFTSMAEPEMEMEEEEEEEEEREARPVAGRRGSSTGSVGTLKANERRESRSRERGSRSRERGGKSRERGSKSRERGSREKAGVREEEIKISPMGSPLEDGDGEDTVRGRGRSGLKPLDSNITVVGSVNSSNPTSGSDWESATDSPAPVDKPLPKVGKQYDGEGLSGLAQVMGAGDRVEAIAGHAVEDAKEESRPTTPTRTNGRAKFQLGSVGTDYEDMSPPKPPISRPPPSIARQTTARPQQPPQATERYPALGLVLPSSPPTAPPAASRLPSNATPPRRTNVVQSTVAFPTTSSPRASPVRPDPYRPRANRQASNASFRSVTSTRSLANSFHGLMGPSSPNFRRAASTAAPQVDRGTVAHAELTRDGGAGPARRTHQRTDSMGSIRSLRDVAESSTGRASTLGVSDSRDLARRLRMSSGSASEGGARAMLGNLGGPQRSSTGPSATRPGGGRRSASGYFASLRGFASANLPGLTPPLSPSASSTTRYPIPGSMISTSSLISKGKARASPTQFQPLISKFLEPTSYTDSPQLSSSPATTRRPLFSRQNHSASTASLGAMSRTQQKAILARDAPYWDNGAGPSEVGTGMGAAFYSPSSVLGSQTIGNGKPVGSMQLWAAGLVREAERIDRQYRAVEKWRDPLGESLERVFPPRKVETVSKKGKGRA